MQKPKFQWDDSNHILTIVIRLDPPPAAAADLTSRPAQIATPAAGQGDIMTPAEAAQYLKLSKAKLYAMIQRRLIPSIKIGRNIRLSRSALARWLDDLAKAEK